MYLWIYVPREDSDVQSDQNLHWEHFSTAKEVKFLHTDNKNGSECVAVQAALYSLGALNPCPAE